MHRLLIVDDEPIILSGIKSLLNWESLGVEIAGTARNGQEALLFIERYHPNIVIADIKMPIMDGISLLKESNERFPDIVFIMLSSLEEFRLAKEAISYSAVDYLLKIELDEKQLTDAVMKAKTESDKRAIIYQTDGVIEVGDSKAVRYISNLLKFRDVISDRRRVLTNAGFTESFAFLCIILPRHGDMGVDGFDEDMERRYEWERQIAEKVISPFFPSCNEVDPISSSGVELIYFLSGFPPLSWNRNIKLITEKIQNASKMVLNEDVAIVHSGKYQGEENLEKARDDFETQMARYYLGKDELELDDLRLDNMLTKIERALSCKDRQAFDIAMRIIRDRIENTDHRRQQASYFLEAVSYAVKSGFKGTDLESEGMKIAEKIEHDLMYMVVRDDALGLLEDLERDISTLLSSYGSHNESIAKAKLYILSHLETQMTLSEIAENSCISSGYLSALFKKTTGISVVDYVNQAKIDKAKEMMANGMRRVDEMAAALGFENIYYFSKVFKKFTGLPPTEYARKFDKRK